jgi:hypothetical protein
MEDECRAGTMRIVIPSYFTDPPIFIPIVFTPIDFRYSDNSCVAAVSENLSGLSPR